MAGWPKNKSFSASRSFFAANACRSVLQKRHFRATALIVSPQTGQARLSASMMDFSELRAKSRFLHPLQRAFLPYPYIPDDQDRQKDEHLEEAEDAERFELYCP